MRRRSEHYRCLALGSGCRCALLQHAPAWGAARELGQAACAGQCLHMPAFLVSTEQTLLLQQQPTTAIAAIRSLSLQTCQHLACTSHAA